VRSRRAVFAAPVLLALAAACAGAAPPTPTPIVPITPAARASEARGFASIDGEARPGSLSLPAAPGRYPVVVTLHGGNGGRPQNVLDQHALATAGSPTVRMLNSEPWAVYAVGYRAGVPFGTMEEDVVAGIRSIKADPRIDPARVAVFGGSHGGHLALRAAIRLGDEISCVAVGSPWMVDPVRHVLGDPAEPPIAGLPEAARDWLLDTRERLRPGLERAAARAGKPLRELLEARSIEGQVERIRVPALFLTSRADVQVHHRLVEPTIAKMRAAGAKVDNFVVEKSLHGFYWGRDGEFGARAGAGPKTDEQRAEEAAARDRLRDFLRTCLK